MTEDLLSQASRALRETTAGEDASARFTRARVMASLHQSRRRRGLRAAFLLPLAAILVGSTAWGAASGRIPAALDAVVGFVMGAPELEAPPPPPVPQPRRAAPVPAMAPSAPVAPDPTEVEPDDRDGVPTAVDQPPPAPVAPAAAAPSARPRPTDPEGSAAHAAYRRAHQAHFVAQDPAAALVGWDEYLRLAPSGRFALEATYNRALCLVRLGRRAEALAALGPFAEGRLGGYRQREARALVSALGGEVPAAPEVAAEAPSATGAGADAAAPRDALPAD